MEELAATAKQVGSELINLSNIHTASMQSWSDIRMKNPTSPTAKRAAGFTTKPYVTTGLEMIIDVLAPPEKQPVLRTWAIDLKTGPDQRQYANNIQLAFTVNAQAAAQLVAQSENVTRENLRQLLESPETKLLSVTVSNEASGTATQLIRGERYDFTADELGQQPQEVVAKVGDSLQVVLGKFKQLPVSS